VIFVTVGENLRSHFALPQIRMTILAQFILVAMEEIGRGQLKCDGTRRRTEWEVKGKLANGVGNQYSSHYLGTWCIQHYYR